MNDLAKLCVRALSMVMCLVLTATIFIQSVGHPVIDTVSAVASDPRSTVDETLLQQDSIALSTGHILLDSIDLLSFGNIDSRLVTDLSSLPDPGLVTLPISTTWREGKGLSFIVNTRTTSPSLALISSTSLRYDSDTIAQYVLDSFPNNVNLLNTDLMEDLFSHNIVWRAWYDETTEDLPNMFFIMQYGPFITQIRIESYFDYDFTEKLLSHSARHLLDRAIDNTSRSHIFIPFIDQSVNYVNAAKPSILRDGVRAQDWHTLWELFCTPGVLVCGYEPHNYAIWNQPSGQNAQYHGNGGNEETCDNTNGCIHRIQNGHRWSWHADPPAGGSALGIPKRFLLTHLDAWTVSNYSATVDVNGSVPTPTHLPGAPTPTPYSTPPTPTPPPTQQGIRVLSVSPHGDTFARDFQFNPEVVVQTTGFSLDCSQNFLQNRDGNLYGTYPNNGCTALGGNQYRFRFGQAMQAPNQSGTYHSRWQVWKYPSHIGPEIDIWFNVAQTPDYGRPPTNPTLRTPADLHTERTGLAPELCWNPSTDPDGEPVKYFVEVRGGRIDDSGWITQTCWRPTRLDGPEYYGYEWRVKAQDPRGIESGWSSKWRFGIQPAPYDPPVPTSTPPAVTPPPSTLGEWWDAAWNFRRPLPIATTSALGAGHIIKVDGFDLEALVAQGKARADHNDLRIVRRGANNTWQEVPRVYYSGWDLEFRLLEALPIGTDTSYYLYYGNPNAGAPPTYALPQGWWADMYVDRGWESFHSTHAFNIPMDFNRDGVCYAPLDHFGRTGQRFDESDKFRSRLWIPTTGDWRFTFYHNDGHEMYLDGRLLVSDLQFHSVDADATSESYTLKAGWHTMELRHMWVNCGSWRFSMEGPGFPRQVVPATYFQQVWGNIKAGHSPGGEETAPGQPTATPTPILPTATPIPTFSYFGDGRDGDMPASGDLNNNNGFGLGSVKGTAGATSLVIYDRHSIWRIKTGDYILIHQTRGTGAGNWELNRATVDFAGNGTTVSVERPLRNSYDTSINGYQNQAQVVRVPQYRNCPVSGTVTPLQSWNGIVGGIFAVMCQNQATISGAIDLSGRGFRGGASGNTYETDQWQGESILSPSGYADHYYQTTNRTPSAQGGGAADNIGGGGGGAGFAPGLDGDHIGGSSWGYGGIGYGTPTLSQIFFGGGGGGAATGINPAGGYATSGNGAGIVFLFARTITITGQVRANGQMASGVQTDDNGNRHVTAGSGGGGQIYIKTETISIGANGMSAVGGPRLAPGGSAPFGGGAGGNGYIYIEHCGTVTGAPNTAPVAVTQSASCTP